MRESEPDLPESSGSLDGASGGSLAGASRGDLKRGYSRAEVPEHQSDAQCCCSICMSAARGGFLDRPQGWER